MSSKKCFFKFKGCAEARCDDDEDCLLQSKSSDWMPFPDGTVSKTDKRCDRYEDMQKEGCTCVLEEDYQVTIEENLRAFYRKQNPDRLDENGEVKDVEEVWAKWKGK